MNIVDLNDKKVELNYPCTWEYKLVVLETCDIRISVEEIILKREHKIKESRTSSKGRFRSYNLEMIVHNEDDRKEIFRLLGEHTEIKMVL